MSKVINRPVRVLQVTHTSELTGPNNAVFALLKGADRQTCTFDVAGPERGEFAARLKGIGVKHIPLEFSPKGDIGTIFRLVSIIRGGDYQVIHGHMGRVVVCISIAGKISGVPAILLTEHMSAGAHSWLKGKPVRRFLHNLGHILTNNCLDRVIAVSEDARMNYIKRQGMDPGKVVTIPNAVCPETPGQDNSQRLKARNEFGFPQGSAIIGMAGRLIEEKGYSDVIKAAPGIIGEFPLARFVVIGEGEYRAKLENSARELGLAGKIKFMGFRNDADSLFYGLDILVQPTWAGSHESFGLVLAEAMLRGIPVIASDIPAFAEMISEGKTGLLFKEKDSPDLGQKIIRLLKDKELSGLISRNASEAARDKFDCKIVAGRTAWLYEQVLAQKGWKLK